MPTPRFFPAALALACAGFAAGAQALCSSGDQPQPTAVLERFISADCDSCWRDAATPRPAAGELALDWIVPGRKGDDAPLSMGATREALARLQALRRAAPERTDTARTVRAGPPQRLHLAHGQPFNDYVGTSIELQAPRAGRWQAWLLLVEQLPVGAEGSPVARNLVRNVFQPPWDAAPRGKPPARLVEARPMQIPEGTRREHLRLVALLYDERGRLVAAAQSHCAE
jgi:hypothetical protein